jgi:hypothetical protein
MSRRDLTENGCSSSLREETMSLVTRWASREVDRVSTEPAFIGDYVKPSRRQTCQDYSLRLTRH